MTNKICNVLSIDFDFFQNVTKEQLQHYPDGVDVSSDISQIIWASHYVTPGCELLKQVDIDETLYQQMINILINQHPDTPIMITNSHIHAYDFIINHNANKPINLYNIDLHHDIINNNETLDCGNWISHLIKSQPFADFQWIARPISIECYGENIQKISNLNITFDFTSIYNKQFDMIFICRSDTWTPPHLDDKFDTLVKTCTAHFTETLLEQQVMKPRDVSIMIDIEKAIQNTISQ